MGESCGEKEAREALKESTGQLDRELWSAYWERKAPNVLRDEARKEHIPSMSYAESLGRVAYAIRSIGVDPHRRRSVERADRRVSERMTDLKNLALEGKLKDEDKQIVEACVEYVENYLKMREWKALVLTFREPNYGLRVSPDLMRELLLMEDKNDAAKVIERYRQESRELLKDADFVFQAHVISYFVKDEPKMGPEHMVPLIETNIDWNTGEKKGSKFLSCMLRYETDTLMHGYAINIANLALNPKPEYEPVTFLMRPDRERGGHMETVGVLSRVHWLWFYVPVDEIKRNEDGKLMITAVEDSRSMINGHMNLPVPKDPQKTYSTALRSNPKLHGVEHIINEAAQGSYLVMSLMQAEEFFMRGERFSIPVQYVMEKSDAHGDPLSRVLREKVMISKTKQNA